jgi:hypothetical protein
VNDAAAVIGTLPRDAARMLAVEILLADPEALGDDVLESCLYILREKLRTPERQGELALPGHRGRALLRHRTHACGQIVDR